MFKKICLVSILALALVVGASASPAFATLTFDATSVTGSGALTLDGAAASALTVGSATTTGNIAIGGALTTGTLTLGKTDQTGITVISGSTSGANTLFNNVVGGTIAIGAANTGGIAIGVGTAAKTITIGSTSTGAETITIGNASAASGTNSLNGYNVSISQAATTGTLTVGAAAATGAVAYRGAVTGGANTLFANATTSNIAIGDVLTTGTITIGGNMVWTPATHPDRDILQVGQSGNSAKINIYTDNLNALDIQGKSSLTSASAGATLDNFLYVNYSADYNNAYSLGTKKNRLYMGTNYDSDFLLQTPHQLRLVAADNTVTGGSADAATTNGVGNILMISRSDVKISPWALPESVGNNYLIISGATHSVALPANTPGVDQYQAGNITLETNAGNLVMQPLQGYVQIYGNAGKRFETTGTGVTVTGALTATTYVSAPFYHVGEGATFSTATPAPTKADLQQASFWPVVTATNTVAIAIPAMDGNDIGRHLTFAVTTGHVTNALTVTNGAGMTLVQVVGTGAATTAEDAGDYIDCLITTAATATCITYAKD